MTMRLESVDQASDGALVANRWDASRAQACKDDLQLRAYSSRLIGEDPQLVLHGGGNTSLKGSYRDRLGNAHEAVWVKASGFDLAKMGAEGFTGLLRRPLLDLAGLETLSDADMVNEVKRARLDADAAQPSIEAIVHAVIPFKFVDHSHPNAVLTLSNAADGSALLKRVYGQDVLILPYVKPGFDLARQFVDCVAAGQFETHDAIILQHHGVFTYSDDAKASYDRMIEVVNQAETYLQDASARPRSTAAQRQSPRAIAQARSQVSRAAGRAVLSLPAGSIPAQEVGGFTAMAHKGTLTPEHVIHNKPFPARLSGDGASGVAAFVQDYTAYFEAANDPNLTMLTPAPHWAIFETGHMRSFGASLKKAQISRDVTEATAQALHNAGQLGGWQGLSEDQLRDLEYWELEQSKLKRQTPLPKLSGKIAVVSGAASGIGKACAETLRDAGAVVVGLDIDPAIATHMNAPGYESRQLDLTQEEDVRAVLGEVVSEYGGLDILVSNAGIFRAGDKVEDLDDQAWDMSLAVNLSSHRKLVKHAIPYLRQGVDPAIVFIGSRNVRAPGAGAAAYSVSKAGLTQLMRVLALELSPEGITVNAVHPDAVFDTALWTREALETSARRYGLTIEEYKTRNLMHAEVTSKDVGTAVLALVDGTLARTTGAQIPVDGGNNRVI